MFTVRTVSKRKKILLLSSMMLGMILLSSTLNLNKAAARYNIYDPEISMVMKTNAGGVRPDICLYVASYIRDLGIEVEVKIEEWVVFLGSILIFYNFDLAYVTLTGGEETPDMRDVYTEDGSLNIFGLTQEMPYGGQSESMQDQGVTILDLDARQQHYYDWQQLLMDKLIPMLPFFSPRKYEGIWGNTHGYDVRWGVADSLPYMSYDGYHEGQTSLNEFNIADSNWGDLNPLFSDRSSSIFIQGLLMEPIFQMNPDFAPLKTGLVYDWDQIDETHYKFWMMDDIWWNPSYNSTDRDANSDPLSTISPGELMLGLKTGTYSDGSNQQVTAKDAVFTYVAWANNVVSESTIYHDWISDIYVDPVDELSFHIHIDGDPDTVEVEPYADMWAMLPWQCLPEFFLNSTDLTVTYTEGGVETTGLYPTIIDTPQWISYSTSAFGCGKYSLDYAILNSVTVLERSPYWFGKGAIDGTTGMEPFVDNINIRVIPDSSAVLAEFKAGKLDLSDLSEFQSERKQMQADSRFDVQSLLAGTMSFLAFNLRRPLIGGASNDVFLLDQGKEEYTKAAAMRKAICYAINRDEINQILYAGEYFVCHSPLYPSNSFYYYNDIIKYDYNIDAAQEWFNAAFIVPKLELTVKNYYTVGRNITFIADYTSGPTVTSSTLYLSVEGGPYSAISMNLVRSNYYSFDIGSEYEEDTLIRFNIVATNIYGDEFETGIFSFRVGTKNSTLQVSYPFISLLTILVIPVTIAARRRKKRK